MDKIIYTIDIYLVKHILCDNIEGVSVEEHQSFAVGDEYLARDLFEALCFEHNLLEPVE